jgi:hypothetical protein
MAGIWLYHNLNIKKSTKGNKMATDPTTGTEPKKSKINPRNWIKPFTPGGKKTKQDATGPGSSNDQLSDTQKSDYDIGRGGDVGKSGSQNDRFSAPQERQRDKPGEVLGGNSNPRDANLSQISTTQPRDADLSHGGTTVPRDADLSRPSKIIEPHDADLSRPSSSVPRDSDLSHGGTTVPRDADLSRPTIPKVEFKKAANGDLLQKAEGGNWYVAKDNPDPGNNVASSSEGLNKKYGLGEYASPTASEALASRSQAMNKANGLGGDAKESSAPVMQSGIDTVSEGMNEKYGLGEYSTPTPAEALALRSEAMNEKYGLGEYAKAPSAPAWHANPNWEATSDASAAVISASGVDSSNVLETRAGANNNTLLRMKDGTYLSIESSGNVSSAGHWDNSQWASSEYASPGGHGGPVNGVDTTIPPGYSATEHSMPVIDSPSSSSSVAASSVPVENNSFASQYSGEVDMAQIERDLASINHQPEPLTLPGGADTDPAGTAGFDVGSSGGEFLNPGQVAGRGRHYAE